MTCHHSPQPLLFHLLGNIPNDVLQEIGGFKALASRADRGAQALLVIVGQIICGHRIAVHLEAYFSNL